MELYFSHSPTGASILGGKRKEKKIEKGKQKILEAKKKFKKIEKGKFKKEGILCLVHNAWLL